MSAEYRLRKEYSKHTPGICTAEMDVFSRIQENYL